MQIWIDNLDGRGALEYTAAVRFGKDTVITRKLNKPVTCVLTLGAVESGLPLPAKGAQVQVRSAELGTVFSGYVASVPAVQAAGVAQGRDVPLITLVAVSAEVLLDETASTTQNQLLGLTAAEAWAAVAGVGGAATPIVALSEQVGAAGRVEIAPGARWSETAAALANTTRSVYRSVAGGVAVSGMGEVVHTVALDDPGLVLEPMDVADLRNLALDVTVCGKEEPTAYVTEVFAGDGTTKSFALSEPYFRPTARQVTSFADLFQGTSLATQVWTVADPGGHIGLTASGLTCSGGSGRDGESTVQAVQQVELGGTVTLEADGVQIGPGSVGVLLGLYVGAVTTANCLAGFAVATSGGVTTLAPLVRGAVAGASFATQAGHLYTLRLRVFSPEMERVRQRYFYLEPGGAGAYGGDTAESAGQLEFEIQDVTGSGAGGVASAPVLLWSGQVAETPAACGLGLLNSGNLQCSVKSMQLTQGAPLWVMSAAAGSTPAAAFIATAVDGGACRIATTGTLTFYPGNVPAAGALIYVNYRMRAHAVARQVLAGANPLVSTQMWIGAVTEPTAWSSVDCENAAAALVQTVNSAAAVVKGTYTVRPAAAVTDIWPGDALQLAGPATVTPVNAYVKEVEIALSPDRPEVLEYRVQFANDWAESLSMKVTTTVPEGTVLPQQATDLRGALASLTGLTVASVTATTVTLQMGTAAPVNGGFEVRRREGTFGPGTDSDLVVRTGTTTLTLARAAAVEQLYVRMYDGSSPPKYSLYSAAVFLNVPTS